MSTYRYDVAAGSMEVMIVSDAQNCRRGVAELRRRLQVTGTNYIGLDAEWNSYGFPSPVALLQLATKDGFCLLIHLHIMQANAIPSELTELLRDASILKVGVQTPEDAERLGSIPGKGHLLQVNGCLDLKYMVPNIQQVRQECGKHIPSLADLARHAGVPFTSIDETRSNWESYQFTTNQVKYAAQDAFVGAKICSELAGKVDVRGKVDQKFR